MGMLFVIFPLLLLIFALCVWSSLVWLICVLGSLSLGLSCLGLCVSWLGLLFPSPFKGNFQLLSPWVFSHGLFFFFFWDSYGSNVGRLTLSQRSLSLSSSLLILFSYFLSVSFISTILSSASLILSSASVILLLVSSRVILISVIAILIDSSLFLPGLC